ncbi:DUF6252 family protein [Salinimicrobium soli]|uniref:DUF6252 family protein n=1 Tax=Salinimicrobium soli TaxID=1254399 RepID=UPI003AABBF32
MRQQFVILCFLIFCISCGKDEISPEENTKDDTENVDSVTDESDNGGEDTSGGDSTDGNSSGGENPDGSGSTDETNSNSGEIFTATVNGEDFIVTNGDDMEAEIRNQNELVLYGANETGEIFMHFLYDGVGVFSTGNDTDGSYAYFYDYTRYCMWLSDRGMGNPGVIEITRIENDTFEGNFQITAYNHSLPDPTKEMQGEFKLLIEND